MTPEGSAIAKNAVAAAAAAIAILVVACSSPSANPSAPTVSSPSAASPTSFPSESYGKPTADPIDVLPSTIGELRISEAWKVSVTGVDEVFAVYDWPGVTDNVQLMCALPVEAGLECDESVPTHFRLGTLRGCGAANDSPGHGGPVILWRGCSLQIMNTGVKTANRFGRLKAAAAEAAAWTTPLMIGKSGDVPIAAVMSNRRAGLLAASRRGNSAAPGLSRQLDP